jgi:hypothetical protein
MVDEDGFFGAYFDVFHSFFNEQEEAEETFLIATGMKDMIKDYKTLLL